MSFDVDCVTLSFCLLVRLLFHLIVGLLSVDYLFQLQSRFIVSKFPNWAGWKFAVWFYSIHADVSCVWDHPIMDLPQWEQDLHPEWRWYTGWMGHSQNPPWLYHCFFNKCPHHEADMTSFTNNGCQWCFLQCFWKSHLWRQTVVSDVNVIFTSADCNEDSALGANGWRDIIFSSRLTLFFFRDSFYHLHTHNFLLVTSSSFHSWKYCVDSLDSE